MKAKLFWLGCLLALPLVAQSDLSSYQGPGVLSAGVGDVGTRSGQQVDLRFWGGVNGVYDTNVQPLTTDAKGNLIHVPNLYGIEANIGAYGSHHWQHAQLGLSYTGTFRHYPESSSYDGTDHALTLGYTVQYSNRIVFDLRASGATIGRSIGAVADAASASGQLATPLFDTRTSYIDVSGSMTFVQSPRTSYTFGGGANAYYYQSDILTSYRGFHVSASGLRRVSLSSSFGAIYTYAKQTAPDASFNSTVQTFAGQYFGNFARFWSVDITAGASFSQVNQAVTVLVAFPNANGGLTILPFPAEFKLDNVYPSGRIEIRRQFQRASASATYDRSVGSGNGFFLGTRNQTLRAGLSYTGIRKWNFGVDGNYQAAVNLGQTAGKSTWYGVGTGFTYEVYKYTHLTARFDEGHVDFGAASYNRATQRVTVGLNFSPGNIPLSLW